MLPNQRTDLLREGFPLSTVAEAGRPCSWIARRPPSLKTMAHLTAASSDSSMSLHALRKSLSVSPPPSLSRMQASRQDTIHLKSSHRPDRRPFLRSMSLGHLCILADNSDTTGSLKGSPRLKSAFKLVQYPSVVADFGKQLGSVLVVSGRLVHVVALLGPDGFEEA